MIALLPEGGVLIAFAGDPNVRKLARASRAKVYFYATDRDETGEVDPDFLIAKGSDYELQTQLRLAVKLGIGGAEESEDVLLLAVEVAKMLNGLSDFLVPRSQKQKAPQTSN